MSQRLSLKMTKAALLKSAFAKHVGISAPRVTQLIAKGLPVTPDGRIDAEEGSRWLADNLDHGRRNGWKGAADDPRLDRGGRRSPDRIGDEKAVANADTLGGSKGPHANDAPKRETPTDGALSFNEARRRREEVRLERESLLLEKERGELVSLDAVERFVEARGIFDRDSHLSWVARTAAQFSSEFAIDAGKFHARLEEEMREHLIALASTPIPEQEDAGVRSP